MNNSDPKARLIEKLREIFEIESADLDFGIYRIMNYKRSEVEKFIDSQLINEVKSQIGTLAKAESSHVEAEIAELESGIQAAFGEDAFEEGKLKEKFQETPLGKRYLAKLTDLKEVKVSEDAEIAVYNHVLSFFSRYYESGDFIGKRRYGRTDRYVVPYHGEEVVLYWATRDQYYVKTTEWFRKYSFKASGVTVTFAISAPAEEIGAAEAEAKRYFLLRKEKPYELSGNELKIYFEFRPLRAAEKSKYGERAKQDDLNRQISQATRREFEEKKNLRNLFIPEGTSPLEKHLHRYTRRNTADYFIHKNLGGFLETELDFYIKNEVLNFGSLAAIDSEKLNRLVLIAKVVHDISHSIIDFLAQVENFQKRLWEKKKFVTKSEYVLSLKTLKRVLTDADYGSTEAKFKRRLEENEACKSDVVAALKETYKQPGNNVYVRDV